MTSIKDDFKQISYYEQEDSDGVPDDHGTSHLSVLAEDGSAVAVTRSIINHFGSGVMSRSTGIIFNDQMKDFIDPELISGPGKNNRIKPVTILCTIILDKHSKQVKMVVGGAGGTNITTSVAQVTKNTENVIDGLKLKNHTIYHNTSLSVVQAIVRQGDKICAESDHRNYGYPAGY
uniref:Uncharacterized protein n=1 Tax=Cyprinus carpio TaxID=7962 RepID=A0A8C1QG44_CYPCA